MLLTYSSLPGPSSVISWYPVVSAVSHSPDSSHSSHTVNVLAALPFGCPGSEKYRFLMRKKMNKKGKHV